MELSVAGKSVYAATGGRAPVAGQEAVVFLHGTAGDHTAWALPARWFAHHERNVLAVDLPGCGRSAGPMPATIEAAAAWVEQLLDAAGLARAALVGHSLGGLIALGAAARMPDRVRSLALIGTALPMRVNAEMLALAQAGDHRAIELMNDWAHGRAAHMGGNAVPGLWLIGGDIRLVERAPDGALADGFALCNAFGEAEGRAAAAAVTCETLLLVGQNDLMTPPAAVKSLAGHLRRSQVVVLPGAGHMLMGERPDEMLEALWRVV